MLLKIFIHMINLWRILTKPLKGVIYSDTNFWYNYKGGLSPQKLFGILLTSGYELSLNTCSWLLIGNLFLLQ